MSNIKNHKIVDDWAYDLTGWIKDVIGIGSGRCNCSPPCQMDPQLTRIFDDYGRLIKAKEMLFYADSLNVNVDAIAPAKERYEVALKQINFYKGMKSQQGKDNYDYWVGEANRIYKSFSKLEKNYNRVKLIEEKYGWARQILGISVMSAKGVGKTATLALALMHFYSMNEKSKGIVTAPKKDLLDDNLKAEIKKWIRHSVECYGDSSLVKNLFEITSDKIFVKVKDKKDWGDTQFCAFRTANMSAPKDVQEQTLQGYHEDFMLLGADEASGIDNVVFKPLMTTMTGKCNIAFIIFNPNRNSGFAYDTHYDPDKSKLWIRHHIDAENSTLVSEDSIQRAYIFFKDDPNGLRVSVLGLPPLDSEDALIPYSKLTDACERETSESFYERSPKIFGFDVGAGGDMNAISIMQGNKCHRIYNLRSSDENEICSWAVTILQNENCDIRRDKIAVDGVGIGFLMPALLAKCGYPNAVKVDSRNSSPDPKFGNMRAYLFWKLRMWLIAGADIPNKAELKKQLSVLRTENKRGVLWVISKEKLKAEGVKSPNDADAMMLAMYFEYLLTGGTQVVEQYQQQQKDAYMTQYSPEALLQSWMGR